ncbi:Protein TONSOKU [Apostasia shenzhenica]|uniref:Protein TONSOKU n=1 Tax=Apostasia shenzhenica TaxID=1088818 RepID=A0A2I0A1Y4_9ASPA|nr:Protein TONSOKU [Apostasia shenzhenica]
MHYSHMIRFDNVEEASKLQIEIQNVKRLLGKADFLRSMGQDYCSETETEGVDAADMMTAGHDSQEITNADSFNDVELDDDIPLRMLVQKSKKSPKINITSSKTKEKSASSFAEGSLGHLANCCDSQQFLGRKRVRVVISDGEDEEEDQQGKRIQCNPVEDEANSCRDLRCEEVADIDEEQHDILPLNASKDTPGTSTPIHIEESTCSFRSKSSKSMADYVTFGSSSNMGLSDALKSAACGSRLDGSHVHLACLEVNNGSGFNTSVDHGWPVMLKVGHDTIYVDLTSCATGESLDIDNLKVEVAYVCLQQVFHEKRSKGLVPVIHPLICCGKVLESQESITDIKTMLSLKNFIEVVISEWVPKRLIKLYMDFCAKASEAPSDKLLKSLYNLEVSEDEVMASDCALQDISVLPFLHALQVHKTIAYLDFSHNSLGNETMEKLQQIFTSSNQQYGGLTLDLHCNRFGPTALFQICECPVMFTRLEVLNLSENRLTDACSLYLSTILKNCKALYSLNIEKCSITSRTIQKVTDSLHGESILSHLSIGKNNPVSGNVMVNLLSKLSSLKRFSELSLTGIRLNKSVVESLCQLVRSFSLSALFLGGTYMGAVGAFLFTNLNVYP